MIGNVYVVDAQNLTPLVEYLNSYIRDNNLDNEDKVFGELSKRDASEIVESLKKNSQSTFSSEDTSIDYRQQATLLSLMYSGGLLATMIFHIQTLTTRLYLFLSCIRITTN